MTAAMNVALDPEVRGIPLLPVDAEAVADVGGHDDHQDGCDRDEFEDQFVLRRDRDTAERQIGGDRDDHNDKQQPEPRCLRAQPERLQERVEVEHTAERSGGREPDVAEQQAETGGVGEAAR